MDVTMLAIAGGVAVVGFAAFSLRKSPIEQGIKTARDSGEVSQLVEAIVAKKARDEATEWDAAITKLWNTYHREAATKLVMAATEHSQADILQYWIQRIWEVEPEIAQAHYTKDFIDAHFKPEVAAKCGRKGCCG